MTDIQRHKTALSRSHFSKPVRLALEEELINSQKSFFDFGCGRGGDIKQLKHLGIAATGWDPEFAPKVEHSSADIVNLGYVLNVIENPQERVHTLQKAWALAQELLIVSAQHVNSDSLKAARPYKDGYITQRGTFQKFYEQDELKAFIENHLQNEAVSLAPGIFLAFKNPEARESFLSQRYRRQYIIPTQELSKIIFEAHQDLFQSLMGFYAERGRLPVEDELPETLLIQKEIGNLKKAFGIIVKMTEAEQWEKLRVSRAQDLMVYLALSRFQRRPQFSQLPMSLQFDIKAHFSSYKNACEIADELLLSLAEPEVMDIAFKACRVGKKLPQELYVHISALHLLPPELRVLEGCARAFIGQVEGANIIKLHRFKPKVSYLSYPQFDKDPHPELAESLSVNLRKRSEVIRDYRNHANPPILHRKEEFVSSDYPHRDKFKRLTQSEEKKGLYENPSRIGFKLYWDELLLNNNLCYSGHRLIKRKPEIESEKEAST